MAAACLGSLLLASAVALLAADPADASWQLCAACLLASLAAALATALAAIRVKREDYRSTWLALSVSSLLFGATAALALGPAGPRAAHAVLTGAAGILAIAAVGLRFPSRSAFAASLVELAPVPVAVTAIPVGLAAGEGEAVQVEAIVLGGLFAVLITVSTRVVSVRGRAWEQAAGSLLFPSGAGALGVAGLLLPLHLNESSTTSHSVSHPIWVAGFGLLVGAALRRVFARSRPPRFAPPPLNGLATFSISSLAVGSVAIAAVVARAMGNERLVGLLEIVALIALGAYVVRAFILRSAVHRLVERLERTSETLRREQDFSSAVLDAAGSLIIVVDREGRIVRWNRACEELSGRLATELATPGAWVQVLPEEEAGMVVDRIERILAGERRNTGENHWIRPDGQRRLISWTNTALLDPDGDVEFAVGVGVDVTDRRRAELDLRRTTSTLRGLIDASPLSIVATDRDDVVQVWSPAATRLTGWPAQVARGRPLAALTVPDDHQEEHERARARLLAGETVTGLETVRRHRDGRVVPVEVSASPLREADGFIMGMVWVETDASARRLAAEALRASEERFRGYFEHAPTGSVISALDGTIVGVNPAFCRMLGYTQAELVGTSFRSITHPDDLPAYQELRDALLRGELPRLEYDKRYLHKDGHAVWAHLSVEVLADGPEQRLFAHVQDVTERKHAELEREEMLELKQQMLAELEAQNDRLRELDRLKDEFLALVSHELRTPLTSIRGYVSVMADPEFATGEPERQRFVEIVERNAQRLERLVEDLLLIAQIDAGKLELESLEVDLARIAADAAESVKLQALRRGIEITLERAGDCRLRGDASRLLQVVDNLLANALKFTPDGGSIRLRVATESSEALVEIEDTGIGIPSEEQAQLFQRFFRATNARERAIKGTGLGLAICRAIVEAHRGWIVVQSEPGSGTRVTVRLPLDERSDVDTARAA